MTESQITQFNGDYILLDKQSLSAADYANDVKTYPQLANDRYLQTEQNQQNGNCSNSILFSPKPSRRFLAIEQNGLAAYAGNSGIPNTCRRRPVCCDCATSACPVAALQSAAETQINAIEPDLLTEYSVAYLSVQYKALGMNAGSIQHKYLFDIGALMVLITLASAACSVTVGYISARIAAGVGRNMRKQLFERVESFSNTEFDKFSTASLITRSTNDITQIQMLLVMLFRIVFYAPILGVGGILKVLGSANSMLWIIGAAVGVLITIMVTMFMVVLA